MTARIFFVTGVGALLLVSGGCDDNDPPPAPSTPQPDVTVIGPCLPKCGNVEQR